MTNEPLDCDALAALEQAATPGPWHVEADHLDTSTGVGGDLFVVHDMASGARHYITSDADDEDAALIAALRNAAPALIAAARETEPLDYLGRTRDEAYVDRLTAERHAARAEVAALRERVADALESLDLLCRDEAKTGDSIRGHEVQGAVSDLRAALTTEEAPHA